MTRLEVRANLLWGALAAFIALFFLLLAPKVGFGIGLLLALVGLVAWSLRRPELLVIGTLIAALLGNLGRLHSAGAGSLTLYQLVFAAAILCYGWLVLTRREPVPRVSPALWLLLLFLVGEFAALPVAKDLSGGVVAFVSLSLGVLFAFLVIGVCTTSSRLRSVLVAFVFLAAAFGFLAVLERFKIFSLQPYYTTFVDGIRARGTFDDPNLFGGMLAAGAVVGVSLAASRRRPVSALLLWGAAGMACLGVVMTLSRGAFLGLLVGALVAVLATPMRTWVRLSLLVLGVAGVGVVFLFLLDPSWVASKVTGIASNDSALYRVYLAKSGLQMFAAHPLGVGPGNWQANILFFRDARVPAGLLASHTTYFTVLVEGGILGFVGIVGGLLAYLWMTAKAAFRAVERETRELAAAALAGGAVLLVQSLTYSLEANKFLWFMVGAGVAAALLPHAAQKEEAS